MTVYELSRDQIEELKISYLDQHLNEVEGRCISYGEMFEIDSLIDDSTIFENYGHYDFCNDDFFCSMGRE